MLKPSKSQRGVTLIEVLVALVVISIGVLGIIGLQLTGVQSNHVSYQYTQASAIASSLAELMQANRAGVLAGNYLISAGTVPAAPAADCLTVSCTPAEQAAWDLAVIYRTLNGHDYGAALPALGPTELLPSGAFSVYCDAACTEDDTRLITVYWDSDRSGADGYGCDIDNDEDLQCFRLPHVP